MTIWISRDVLLFNFECLDILCTLIGHPSEKLVPYEFLEGICCSILSVSTYYVPKSYIRVKSYDHLNFSIGSVVQFRASRYIMTPNGTSMWKVRTIWISRGYPLFNFELHDILWPRIGHPFEKLWPFEFLERFRCSISSISIYYVPESNIRVKSCDHWNFSIASVVQFRASWHYGPRIGHPCEKLRPFKFLESFRCSISSV